MRILKYILLPFVFILDHFNYCSHLENNRYVKDYKLYKTPKWINNFYKSLKKGEKNEMERN